MVGGLGPGGCEEREIARARSLRVVRGILIAQACMRDLSLQCTRNRMLCQVVKSLAT